MFAILIMTNFATASPWTRPAGEVHAKLGAGHFEGTAAFEPREGRFYGDAGEAAVEVGIGGGLELDGAMRFVSNRVGNATNIGPGDAELVLEWAPVSSTEAFALVLGTRLSTYARGGAPERGYGGADLLVGGGWGRTLGVGWVASDVLLVHRLGSPSSGIRLRTELGVKGDTPFGSALGVEVQPAFGDRASRRSDGTTTWRAGGPAPVPRTVAITARGFARLVSGFGVETDLGWWPAGINDGPGFRIGAGLTWLSPPRYRPGR